MVMFYHNPISASAELFVECGSSQVWICVPSMSMELHVLCIVSVGVEM